MIDAQADYTRALAEINAGRRARRRALWPEERARRMRLWVAERRRGEEAGQPFVMGPQPPEEPDEAWFADDPTPTLTLPEPVTPGPQIAPGVDALGRPQRREPTPEEALAAAQAKAGWWRP